MINISPENQALLDSIFPDKIRDDARRGKPSIEQIMDFKNLIIYTKFGFNMRFLYSLKFIKLILDDAEGQPFEFIKLYEKKDQLKNVLTACELNYSRYRDLGYICVEDKKLVLPKEVIDEKIAPALKMITNFKRMLDSERYNENYIAAKSYIIKLDNSEFRLDSPQIRKMSFGIYH